MERSMTTLTKSLLASIAVVGLLAGCATYDYGYGYSQPYYGYGYGYDYGPSYYDYGYYGPGYYIGPPAVGLDFQFRDRDRHEHAGRRHVANRSVVRSYSRPRMATRSASSSTRNRTLTGTRTRAPTVARAQGNRGGARIGSQQARNEQP
jgi:hypothetical protein